MMSASIVDDKLLVSLANNRLLFAYYMYMYVDAINCYLRCVLRRVSLPVACHPRLRPRTDERGN